MYLQQGKRGIQAIPADIQMDSVNDSLSAATSFGVRAA